MGSLRTSEQGGEVVGGEAKQVKSDDNRKVDAPGQIIIDAAPAVTTAAPTRPTPPPISQPAPAKSGGLGMVVFVYVLATAALGAAIYERFFM